MRIVNLDIFRLLPMGTVYSRYEPCIFTGLEIKGATWESDFLYRDLIGNVESESSIKFAEILDKAEKNGSNFNLEFACSERDGLFEKDQLFAIYSKEDLEGLINTLKECLEEAYSDETNPYLP